MIDPTRVISNENNPNKNYLIKFLVLSVPYEIKNADDKIAPDASVPLIELIGFFS